MLSVHNDAIDVFARTRPHSTRLLVESILSVDPYTRFMGHVSILARPEPASKGTYAERID